MTFNQQGTLNITNISDFPQQASVEIQTCISKGEPITLKLDRERSTHIKKKKNVNRGREVRMDSYSYRHYICLLGTASYCSTRVQTLVLLSNKSTYHCVAGSVWRANIISVIPGLWNFVLAAAAAGWKWSCSTDYWWQPAISLRWSTCRLSGIYLQKSPQSGSFTCPEWSTNA